MELVGPANKRIKLEHSYAAMNHSCLMDCSRIKEEDPLKISFEDTTIKTENEDGVVVKKEASESTEPSQSFEYFNFPSISQEFENHSPSESDTLLADESVRSNNERDCLELINNCDIIKNVEDPLILVDKYDEAVPKLIFLEFLKNYENTIKDLKSQNEKLINEAARLSKANDPVLPEDHTNDPLSTSRCPSKWELQLEVKKLRQELKASRAQEKMLEMRANMRKQIEETFRRINAALQEQFGDNFNRAGCPEDITRLKRDLLLELQKIRQLEESQAASEVIKLRTQLSTKDAQCSSLTSELWKLSKEFDTQKADLFKATQNVVTLKKKLAESTIIRQTLKLHNVRLGKELKEWMVNPSVQDLRLLRKNLFDKNVMLENLKAQNVKLGIELQALRSNPSEGAKLRQTVAELQKSLDFEIANNTQLTIERDRLRAARQTTMYQEQSEKERQGLRTALRLEMEECKNLRERIKKLTEKYTPKEQEIEKARALLIGKEIAYKTKVCDYCGH